MREKALAANAVDLALALGQMSRILARWATRRRIASYGLLVLVGLLGSPAADANTPVGWLDTANPWNNRRISGWALDTAVPSTSIDVHIYFDIGTPQVRGYAVATNAYRPDVNAALGVGGIHGFDFLIPPELLDGVQHKVDAFAIDPHNAGNPFLAGCPKYFSMYGDLPLGYLEAVDAGSNRRIRGWALAPSDPSMSITVHLFFDRGSPRERAYIVPTNVYRPDVNAAYGVSGNHGFDFEIPSEVLDGVQHWVDVIAIDPHSTRTPFLGGCPTPFARSLSAAGLVSPSGNTYDASPVLVWSPAAGATRYWVQIDNVSDPAVGVAVYTSPFDSAQVCSATTCAVATGTGLAQGPYRWNVNAQSAAGKTWSNGLNFTVLAPPGPAPIAPSGATTSPTPTFTWSKSAGATRYWLAVFDQAGNVALQGDSYPSGCSGSTCTWAPGKFFTAGPYTWRVEAQSAAGKTWSGSLGFTVMGPPAAVLRSPVGNTTDAVPTFTWDASAGATEYWLSVDDLANPAEPVSVVWDLRPKDEVCSGSSCSLAPGKGLAAGTYRWNVQARNAVGKTWGPALTFTVQNPGAPNPLAPTGSSESPTPTFTWSKASGATRYWVAVLDQAGVVALQGDSYPSGCSGSTCTWAPGKFFSAGPYTWRVEAQSAAGKTWSGSLGFTVLGPAAAVLRSPVGNTTDAVPTFTWDASPSATEYWLSVDDVANPAEPVSVVWDLRPRDEVCSGSSCSLAPGKGLAAGIYRWNVQARNSVGKTWGEARTFTVSTLPAPVPVAPSGAASAQPTYRWKPVHGATGYVIQVDDATGATVLRGWHSASANCSASDCAVTPSGALDTLGGGVYRWYVLARNSAGDGAFSPGMRFFTPSWSVGKGCRGVFLAADFNADGRTDQLCSRDGVTNVALSTGAGFASPVAWLDQELGAPIIADFNGDGAADIAEYDGGGKAFWVALSSGSAFASSVPWGTATAIGTDGQAHSCAGTGSARAGTGNFDGNGYADVYCIGDGSRIFVGKSTGSGFVFSIFAEYSCWGVYERSGPADFDGDGRDDWYCIDGYGGLYGRLSNGQAFEDMSFQGPGRGVCQRDDWTFVDINGDGRTDVTCRPNGYVGLSTGSAILDTGSGGNWCNSWETIQDPEHPDDPSQTVEVLRSQVQPMDTDGDRMPELVCTFAGAYVRDVHVRKWDGEKLGPPQGLAEMWCRGAVQGGDFDGDGKFELVCDNGAVLRAGTPNVVPDLMVEAANGIGGRTTASYGPSSSFGCNKPPVRQVVTGLTTDDGRGGTANATSTYCDGRTDPAEGTFLGYGQVQTKAPPLEGETAGPTTTVLYSQDLRSLGRPRLVRRSDGAGELFQEVQTEFQPQSGPALPRQALVKEVRTTDFAPSGGETKTTSVSYAYDAYANVTQQFSHGEVTRAGVEIPNDELWTDTTYRPADTERYLVSLPRLREVHEQREGSPLRLKSVETGYDAAGDLTSVSTAVLPGGGHLLRMMGYDDAGRLVHVTSELGAETTITYSADGLHPETLTGPEGSVTTLWHPLCDSPTQVTDPNGSTSTTYDELCRPLRTDGPLGAFTERSYESFGDPLAQHLRVEAPGSEGNDYSEEYFDGLGRTYRSIRRGPSTDQDILTERSYNARGGLASVTEPFSASATEPFHEGDSPDATAYAYDSFDRVVTVTNPDRTTTEKSYGLWSETTKDPRGKPTTTTRGTHSSVETTTIEGVPVTTTHTHDMLGRRVRLEDGGRNAWTWTYDSLDRVRHQQDPDSGPREYVYNDDNRTQTETDAEGHTLTIEYDTLGRVRTKTSPVGVSVFRYSEPRADYKNLGRLTSVLSPRSTGSPISLEMDYDAAGRVVRQARSIPEAGFAGAILKEYDAAGQMTGLRYPDGDTIGRVGGFGSPFVYDGAGRLTTIPGILDAVTYDASGRPLEQRNGNGTVTVRTYLLQRGLLETLTTTHPVTGPIQSLVYGYEDDLPLVRSVRSAYLGESGDYVNESWDYGYDTGYRLTTSRADPNGDEQTFRYDPLGRLEFNSRVSPYPYLYPEPGQPHPHAPRSVAGETFLYSDNGNLLSGGGHTPTWDAENRVAAIGTTRFAYDTFGERVMKTSPESTSLYPFGDDYEITNGIVTKYISVEGLGVIAKRVTGGPEPGTYYLHTDRLGSIQAITSDGSDPSRPAGAIVFRQTYRPYGETFSQTGDHTESRGWIDQRNDGESGLTYLHARYFDPKLGTFLSPDPIGVRGGLNEYGYASGDPINRVDPSGLADCQKSRSSTNGGPWGSWTYYGNCSASEMSPLPYLRTNAYGSWPMLPFLHNLPNTQGYTTGTNYKPGEYKGQGTTSAVVPPEEAPPDGGVGTGTGPGPVLFVPPGVSFEYPISEFPEEALLGTTEFCGILGATCVPGVGEAMDLQVLTSPEYGPLAKALAALSLVLSVVSDGATPNAGVLFTKNGIRVTSEFEARLVQRASRGVTEARALDAYRNGRLFFDEASGYYVRHSSRTGITVITNAPTNGLAITVFEGAVSPRWKPVRWRPGQ